MAASPERSTDSSGFPKDPIDEIIDPLKRFMHVEASSGIVLIVVTFTP